MLDTGPKNWSKGSGCKKKLNLQSQKTSLFSNQLLPHTSVLWPKKEQISRKMRKMLDAGPEVECAAIRWRFSQFLTSPACSPPSYWSNPPFLVPIFQKRWVREINYYRGALSHLKRMIQSTPSF